MASERIQRQIERFLDEAEEAVARGDWLAVRDCAQKVLAFDRNNPDALSFLEATGFKSSLWQAPIRLEWVSRHQIELGGINKGGSVLNGYRVSVSTVNPDSKLTTFSWETPRRTS